MTGKHNVYHLFMLYFPHHHHRRRRSTCQHDFRFIGNDGITPMGITIYLCIVISFKTQYFVFGRDFATNVYEIKLIDKISLYTKNIVHLRYISSFRSR